MTIPSMSEFENLDMATINSDTINATIPDESHWRDEYKCNLYDFIIEAVLMGTLCVFGFVGNTLSSICLWKDQSKSATPFLLVSLELFDTLFLITVVFLRVITTLVTFAPDILPGLPALVPYIGKYIYPCALTAETGTIYVTLLVTFNRYVAVCRPYEATNLGSLANARLHVIIVIIFSVLFNFSRFFEYDIVEFVDHPHLGIYESSQLLDFTPPAVTAATAMAGKDIGQAAAAFNTARNSATNLTNTFHDSTNFPQHDFMTLYDENVTVVTFRRAVASALLNNQVYAILYSNILYFFAMFLFPLAALVMLNYRLMRALQKTRRKREALRRRSDVSTGSSSRSEDDITMMLIVVVLVFVITQAPALVTQVLGSLLQRHDEMYRTTYMNCPNLYFYYARISDLLIVLNSSINFVVYCLCSRRFRQILLRILCGAGDRPRLSISHDPRRQSEATGFVRGEAASVVAPCSPRGCPPAGRALGGRVSLEPQDAEVGMRKKSVRLHEGDRQQDKQPEYQRYGEGDSEKIEDDDNEKERLIEHGESRFSCEKLNTMDTGDKGEVKISAV